MQSAKSNRDWRYRAISAQFRPSIWIDGPHMFVSCVALSVEHKHLTEIQEQYFARVVHLELIDNWSIDSKNLTLEYDAEKYRYRINFNDDEEFIMVKLIHG